MAEIKISALPAATAPAGTEVVPVVQGGVTKKMPVGAANGLATLGADGKHLPSQSATLVAGLNLLGTDAAGNTTKLVNAIADAPVGSTLRLPTGYIAFANLVITKEIAIEGEGWQNSVNDIFGTAAWRDMTSNRGTVLLSTATTGVGIEFSSSVTSKGLLRDLMLVGPGTGTSTGLQLGSVTKGLQSGVVSNVLVANWAKGVHERGSQECETYGMRIRGCLTGLHLSDAAINNSHVMTEIQSCTDALLHEGSTNEFYTLLIQACTGSGIRNPAGNTSLHIYGLWSENTVRGGFTGLAVDLEGTGHIIEGAHFSGSASDCKIRVAANGCTFSNFVGGPPSGAATYTNTGADNVYINASLNAGLNDTGSGTVVISSRVIAREFAIRSAAGVESIRLLDAGGGNGRVTCANHGATDFGGTWVYRNLAGTVEYGKWDDAAADTQTHLLVRRNVAGVFSLVRVSMGPVDSGGVGFRALRVPN